MVSGHINDINIANDSSIDDDLRNVEVPNTKYPFSYDTPLYNKNRKGLESNNKINCPPQYYNSIEKDSDNSRMILTLLIIAV